MASAKDPAGVFNIKREGPWTEEEEAKLVAVYHDFESKEQVAQVFGRSNAACRKRYHTIMSDIEQKKRPWPNIEEWRCDDEERVIELRDDRLEPASWEFIAGIVQKSPKECFWQYRYVKQLEALKRRQKSYSTCPACDLPRPIQEFPIQHHHGKRGWCSYCLQGTNNLDTFTERMYCISGRHTRMRSCFVSLDHGFSTNACWQCKQPGPLSLYQPSESSSAKPDDEPLTIAPRSFGVSQKQVRGPNRTASVS